MSAALDTLQRAVGRRHGIVLPPAVLPRIPADPSGIVHASVPRDDGGMGSAGGGVGCDEDTATVAAIAEALERYAANVAELDVVPWGAVDPAARRGFDDLTLHTVEQRAEPQLAGAGYDDAPLLAETWRLDDLQPCWMPACLVGLSDRFGTLSTSSGLAAGPTLAHALLRAIEELIERDAFMGTWLHQLPGREVDHEPVATDVEESGGWLRVFDLTQAWSPHPVAAVVGMLPLDGEPRCSLGLACRGTWAEAVAKAELECLQGITFAGHEVRRRPDLASMGPEQVTDFDRHATFYTFHPERFADLPLLRALPSPRPEELPPAVSTEVELERLVRTLADADIELFGRELTTIDLHQIGLRVVRVIAPALTPIHHDHRSPFLGGTTPDHRWRYPDLDPLGPFPSPHPHPLG